GRSVRRAIVDARVAADVDDGVCLSDAVIDGAAGVVVIARGIREGPDVAGIGPGAGVCGAAQVQTGQALAGHARGRAGGRVRQAIVSHTVGRDDDAGRVRLGDAVIDGA